MTVADEDLVDEELLRMTGSGKAAAELKEGLRRLRDGAAGSDLAEVADELLSGRANLREIGQSSAYAAQFTAAFAKFRRWQADLTDEERETFGRDAYEKYSEGEPDHDPRTAGGSD